MKTLWLFLLVFFEIFRQMFVSLMTDSESYEILNNMKERENYIDLLRPLNISPEQFERDIEKDLLN